MFHQRIQADRDQIGRIHNVACVFVDGAIGFACGIHADDLALRGKHGGQRRLAEPDRFACGRVRPGQRHAVVRAVMPVIAEQRHRKIAARAIERGAQVWRLCVGLIALRKIPPRHGKPFAGLDPEAMDAVLNERCQVFQRDRARSQVACRQVGGRQRMDVRIDQPGQDQAPRGVLDCGTGPDERFCARLSADVDDRAAAYRQRLRVRLVLVFGHDPRVLDHQIGRRLGVLGDGRQCRAGQKQCIECHGRYS